MSMVIDRLNVHYNFAKEKFGEDNIIGLFLVGSQNYGTDVETSDVDTKLIIAPTLSDIYAGNPCKNKTYKIPDSKDQMTVKDIRSFLSELRKQNINIVEVLFTNYYIINLIYKNSWQQLIDNKEIIAHYNLIAAVKATKGIAFDCYGRLYNEEGKVNPKQTANLVRLEYFLKQYINGKSYVDCIQPKGETLEYIKQIRAGKLGNSALSIIAESNMNAIKALADAYVQNPNLNIDNPEVDKLFADICKEIIDTAFFAEYARNGEI